MISLLLYLYLFFASWGGAFTLSPWLPLHVLLLLSAFILSIPYILTEGNFPKHIYHFEDIFILFGILAMTISGILNPNEKSMNYLKAYFYIFGIGYFVLKFLLYKKTSLNKLFTVNFVAVLFIAAFAITEVAADYFVGFNVQSFIPRLRETQAGYNRTFIRAYAFANEPGTLAFFFNTLGILALWKLWNYKDMSYYLKFILSGILFIGWMCTFSASGIAFASVSIIIALIIRSCDIAIMKKKVLTTSKLHKFHRPTLNYQSAFIKLTILAAILIMILLIAVNYEFVRYAINPIVSKITLQRSSVSAASRLARWNYALENIFIHPFFGNGIGYLSSRNITSSNNWYLFLALEGGLISVFSFLLFLLFTLIRIVRSKTELKYWFLIGFLAGSFNFITSSTIFHPFLWILIALFNVVEEKQKAGNDFNIHSREQYILIASKEGKPCTNRYGCYI